MSDTVNANAIIVWFHDSKMKFRIFQDEPSFDQELERLKQTIPPRCIFALAVNWTDQDIMTFIGDQIGEEPRN